MAVTNEEIVAFLQANPNMSDADIVANMQMYGVTPQQLIQATGMSPSEGLRRYNAGLEQLGIPQTGLQGAEQSMNQGLQSALEALVKQNQLAQEQVQAGNQLAQDQYNLGREDIRAAIAQGVEGVNANTAAGQAALAPYQQMGQEVIDPLLNLSGARGQDAFDSAVVESPYTRYLAEMGERAVTRNAAALGGLGSGNVLLELQRQGQWLASQGLQQQYQNMAGLMGQGANAAQSSAQLSGNAASLLGGLFQNQAGQLGNIANNAAGTQYGTGQILGGMTNQLGQNIAEGQFSLGNTIGQNRLAVGQQIAQQDYNTRLALANNASTQGQQVSDLYGVQSGNLANLLTGAGMSQAEVARIIAAAQAQAAQTQAGQQAGLPTIPGVQQTSGILGSLAGAAEGGANAATAIKALSSDMRLKENITPVGSVKGINLYTWDWKPEFSDITIGMPTAGVLAQEVMKTHPDAVSVGEHGYLMVDYSKVN